MEIISGDFLWGSNNHPMAWERIALPVEEGGLGLRSFKDLAKWATLRRICKFIKGEGPWAEWMRKRYKKGLDFIYR